MNTNLMELQALTLASVKLTDRVIDLIDAGKRDSIQYASAKAECDAVFARIRAINTELLAKAA